MIRRERTDLVAVHEQVDRQHQHEHGVEGDRQHLADQAARERDDVARALEDVLLQRLQRGLSLLLDVDVDLVAVEPAL
jgi:hypothetical protein